MRYLRTWWGGIRYMLGGSHGCPYDAVARTCGEYGPVFRTEVLTRKWWVSGVYDHAREVLIDRREDLVKGATFDAVRSVGLGGKGIFTTDGEGWKRQRSVVQPAFRRASVKGMLDHMNRGASQTVTLLRGVDEVLVNRMAGRISLETACRVAMGVETNLLDSLHDRSPILERMTFAAGQVMRRVQGGPLWKHLPLPSNWKLRRVIAEQVGFLEQILSARDREEGSEEDLMGLLFKAFQHGDRGELKDHMQNFLTAGQETTAATLSWLLYYLAENPELQERVAEEVARAFKTRDELDAAALKQLPLLHSCILETLRLRPAAPYLMREALVDTEVGGYRVQKGSFVMLLTGMMHRDPDYWGVDAEVFKPSRFEGGVPAEGFLPFGLGPRKCIGEGMAMYELAVVTAHLLKHYVFSSIPDQVVAPYVTIAWGFKYGLRLGVTPRW